jgi:hypothetical protein
VPTGFVGVGERETETIEGCEDQLLEWFKYRLIPDPPTLKDYIRRGVFTIDKPNIWTHVIGGDLS